MENNTEYVLTPVVINGNGFADLAEKVRVLRQESGQVTAPVVFVSNTTAIVEIIKSYEITQKGEGKKNG